MALGAFLAGALLLGTATPARANLELDLQDGNGTVVHVNVPNDQGPAVFIGTLGPGGAGGGDFQIFISVGSSNSPGTNNLAYTQQGTVDIINLTGSTHTLHINVSAQNFTDPQSPPPLLVTDTISGSVLSGNLLSGTFQGFADTSNALFGTGFAGQNLNIGNTGQGNSFHANGSANGFSPNGVPYSLSNFLTVQLSGGGHLTLTGGNVETLQPAPAPAGMVLALTALPCLALGWLRRRTRKAAQ
jgi:hypothetical protein